MNGIKFSQPRVTSTSLTTDSVLTVTAANVTPPDRFEKEVKTVGPYQFVLDLSSTTSLKAAVNAGPFLLRFTAIVVLSIASQLAIRDAPFLNTGRSGDDADFQLLRGS